MDFSGIDRGSVVGRLLRAPLAFVPDGARMRVLQGALRGKRWIAGSHTHGCWLGSYEHEKQQLFAALMKPGMVVYDIGANAGFYTLLAADLTGPSGFVVAFEPQPRNLHYLRAHLRLNRIENATVLDLAVAEAPGTARFSATGPATGTLSDEGDLVVRQTSLDALIESHAVRPPDLVKIDIEGGELAAIRGARRVLAQYRPILMLATHGSRIHDACIEELRELGYGIQSIDGRPIEESDELLARA